MGSKIIVTVHSSFTLFFLLAELYTEFYIRLLTRQNFSSSALKTLGRVVENVLLQHNHHVVLPAFWEYSTN